jgi:hypothetical protein
MGCPSIDCSVRFSCFEIYFENNIFPMPINVRQRGLIYKAPPPRTTLLVAHFSQFYVNTVMMMTIIVIKRGK